MTHQQIILINNDEMNHNQTRLPRTTDDPNGFGVSTPSFVDTAAATARSILQLPMTIVCIVLRAYMDKKHRVFLNLFNIPTYFIQAKYDWSFSFKILILMRKINILNIK